MTDARTQCANAALQRLAQPPPHWMTDLCDTTKHQRREHCLHAALKRFVQQPQEQYVQPLRRTAKRRAVDSTVRETLDALFPLHWTQTQGRTAQRTPVVADPIKRACTPAYQNRHQAALWYKEWNTEHRREQCSIRKRKLAAEDVRSEAVASPMASALSLPPSTCCYCPTITSFDAYCGNDPDGDNGTCMV
eukprot:COSAG02_NODE_3468_length_6694_cov_2.962092_5_plen_191_part_00